MKKTENEMISKETGVINIKSELKKDINNHLKYCNQRALKQILNHIINLPSVNYMAREFNKNKNLILLTTFYNKISVVYNDYTKKILCINFYDYFKSQLENKIRITNRYVVNFIKKFRKFTQYGRDKEYSVNYAKSKNYIEHLENIVKYCKELTSKISNTIEYLKEDKTILKYFKNNNSIYLLQRVIIEMEILYNEILQIEEYYFDDLKYQESIK